MWGHWTGSQISTTSTPSSTLALTPDTLCTGRAAFNSPVRSPRHLRGTVPWSKMTAWPLAASTTVLFWNHRVYNSQRITPLHSLLLFLLLLHVYMCSSLSFHHQHLLEIPIFFIWKIWYKQVVNNLNTTEGYTGKSKLHTDPCPASPQFLPQR